jgi:hypothetical protein
MYIALSLIISLGIYGMDKESDQQYIGAEALLKHIHQEFSKQCAESGIKKVINGKEKCALLQSFIESEQVWSSDRVYEWAHYREERHHSFVDLMQQRMIPFINGKKQLSFSQKEKDARIKLKFTLPQKLASNSLLKNIYKVDSLDVNLDKYTKCRYVPVGWRSGNTVCSINMRCDKYKTLLEKIDNEK